MSKKEWPDWDSDPRWGKLSKNATTDYAQKRHNQPSPEEWMRQAEKALSGAVAAVNAPQQPLFKGMQEAANVKVDEIVNESSPMKDVEWKGGSFNSLLSPEELKKRGMISK